MLIDTGFMREGNGEAMAEKFGIPEWVSPLEQLANLGVRPGGRHRYRSDPRPLRPHGLHRPVPEAHLYIQKRELLQLDRGHGLARALRLPHGALDSRRRPHGAPRRRGAPIDTAGGDRRDVLPGIHVVLGADSHTFGSQYVVVDTADRGPVVVAGDCAYSYANFTGLDDSGVYIPLGFGVGSHYESLMVLDKMMTEVDGDLSRIIVLHDFERWERFERSVND